MPDPLFTTRNRSFSQSSIRKRILRSNSQQESQKQLVRNSTMATFMPKLQRLVQEGKIQQFLCSDKHSKAKLFYSTHINQLQKQLADTKKTLSSMSLKARSRQLSINKLKSEIARINRQKQMIKSNNQAMNKVYQTSVSSFDMKKGTKEMTQWMEKSYLHMKERLVKDEYYHKIEYQRKQAVMQAQRSRAQYLQKKSQQIDQLRRQLQHALSQAKKITIQQTGLKNQLIDVINQDQQQKQFLNQLKVEKQKKQSEINQLSVWVIEKEDLKKYLDILYTHKILNQIIRVKNNNLMKRYGEVQSAYLHIKSNTNILEFQRILKRMQEQDSIYDITVKKVSDLQLELEAMEQTIQNAKREKQNILSQEGTNQKLSKGYYQGRQRDNYELLLSKNQKFEYRVMQDDILKKRIVEWGHRVSDKLGLRQAEGLKIQDILTLCVAKLKQKKK